MKISKCIENYSDLSPLTPLTLSNDTTRGKGFLHQVQSYCQSLPFGLFLMKNGDFLF